jgi:hypothetical protein
MVALVLRCLIRSFLSAASESATGERVLHALSGEPNRIRIILLAGIQAVSRSAISARPTIPS